MAEHRPIATDGSPDEEGIGGVLEVARRPASRRDRSYGPVDAAVGVGHPLMPVEHIASRLARIASRGVRTAKVQVVGGVPCVMTKDLPEGVHAVMLADRIEAVRTATGAVVATVPWRGLCATIPVPKRSPPNHERTPVAFL